MRKIGIFLCCISAISFGFVPLFTKVVLNEGLDVIAIGFFRFLIMGIFSLVMILVKKIPLRLETSYYPSIALDSLFQVVTMILLSTSYLFIPTGNATALHFMYPVFVFLILYFYYRNRFTQIQWIALILSAAGMLCFLDFQNMDNWIGLSIAVISGFTYAIYMVILDKKGLAKINPFVLAFYACFLISIALGIIGLFTGSFSFYLDIWGLICFICLAGLCIVGTLLLQVGTRKIGSGMASLFCLFEPLTSLFCGWFLMNDPIRIGNVLGCILIFIGIFLILLPKKTIVEKIYWKKRGV